MKKALVLLALALILLIGTILVRTWRHQPQALAPIAPQNIELDEDLIARHLSEAIQFRTVSHQRAEGFVAEEFEQFIGWVQSTYPEVNASMELVRLGNYTLLYRWAGADASLKPILVAGHYDVVPVPPGTEKLWQHHPFAGEIADGIIWGRGALDNKSAVIAQLEAATHLLKLGFQPKRTVYFSFGHDEEIGGPNGAAEVARYLSEQGIQLAWSLDEGSFLFDGMFPGVEPLIASINVAEKGSVTLDVVATSDGGHSSMPPQRTAVGILADAISALEDNPIPGGLTGLSEQMFDAISRYMPFANRMLFANRWLFGSLLEDKLSSITFTNALLRTTTAPTMLSGSVKVNILPIEAVATVNFRVHPRDTVQSVIEHVESVVGNDNVEVRQSPEPGRAASEVSDWESVGYRTIQQSIREIYGEVLVTPGLMIAGSDSRHYGKVADNAFRFNPMVVSQEDLTGFHGTNEKISVENLAQGTRIYIQILKTGSRDAFISLH